MPTAKPDHEIKDWYLHGEGLKVWATKSHPWTSLRDYLVEHAHFTHGRAARTASTWYREHFGHWPGERKGKNPAGPG